METDWRCLAVVLVQLLLFGKISVGIDWPRIVVSEGQSVVIPCTTQGDPLAYFWKKGNFYNESETVASLVYGILHQSSERFEITEDGTLLIREISSEDGGRYYCRTTSTENECHGIVTVYVKGKDTHSSIWIEECNPQTSCRLLIPISTSQSLTCKAKNVPSATKLVWINGTREIADQRFLSNKMDSEISNTINIVFENPSVLICFAVNELSRSEDIPEIIAHVSLAASEENTAPIIWIVLVAVLCLILLVVVLVFAVVYSKSRCNHSGSDQNKDVENKPKKKKEKGSKEEKIPMVKNAETQEKLTDKDSLQETAHVETTKSSSKIPADAMSTSVMVSQGKDTEDDTKTEKEEPSQLSPTSGKYEEEKVIEEQPQTEHKKQLKDDKTPKDNKPQTTIVQETPQLQPQTEHENQMEDDKTPKDNKPKTRAVQETPRLDNKPKTTVFQDIPQPDYKAKTRIVQEAPRPDNKPKTTVFQETPQPDNKPKTRAVQEAPRLDKKPKTTVFQEISQPQPRTEHKNQIEDDKTQKKVETTHEDQRKTTTSEMQVANESPLKDTVREEEIAKPNKDQPEVSKPEAIPHEQVFNEPLLKETFKEGDIQVCFRGNSEIPDQRWKDFDNVRFVTKKQSLESLSELAALIKNAIDGNKSCLMMNISRDDSKQIKEALKPIVKKLYDLANSKRKSSKIVTEWTRMQFMLQEGDGKIPKSPRKPPPPPPSSPVETEESRLTPPATPSTESKKEESRRTPPAPQSTESKKEESSKRPPPPPPPTKMEEVSRQSKDDTSISRKSTKERRAPQPPGQTPSTTVTKDNDSASGNGKKNAPSPQPSGQSAITTNSPEKESENAKTKSKRDPPPPPPKQISETSVQDKLSRVKSHGIKLPPLPPRPAKLPHESDGGNLSDTVISEGTTQVYKCRVEGSSKIDERNAASFEKAWKLISQTMQAKPTPDPQNLFINFSIYSNSQETTHPGTFALLALSKFEEVNKCLRCTDGSRSHLLLDKFTSLECKTLLLIDGVKDARAEQRVQEILDQIKTLRK